MRFLALVSVLVLAVAVGGCQEKPAPPAPPAAKTFVVITSVASSDVTAGAKAAAEPGTTVKFVETTEAAAQVKELEGVAAARSADGVAIDCVPVPEVSVAIAKCVKAGIPVVTFDSDCLGAGRTGAELPQELAADPGRHCFIGTDLTAVGQRMAYELLNRLGDAKGLVAVVSAPEHPSLKVIEEAIRAYLADTPGVTVVEPVRPAVEPNAVAAAIQDVLAKEPNVRGWLILNPAAVPDMAAAPLAKLGQAEVVMFGFHEAALLAVGPEKVDLLIYVPFVEYGAAAVKVLDGITRRHENYPNEVVLPVTAVTLDNLERVTSARKKMLSGDVSALVVVPSGGAKPNQPAPAEAEEAKPAEPPAAPQAAEQPKPAEPTPPAEPQPAQEKPAAGQPAGEKPAEGQPAAENKPAEGGN